MYFDNLDELLVNAEKITKKSSEESQQVVYKNVKLKLENDIASRLRAARERLGFTQQEMLQECRFVAPGLSAYSKWECGVNMPSFVFLAYLQEVYGVDLNELIAGGKAPVPALPQEVVQAIITLTNYNRKCQFGN